MVHTLMARAGITDPSGVAKIGDSGSDIEDNLGTSASSYVAIESCKMDKRVNAQQILDAART